MPTKIQWTQRPAEVSGHYWVVELRANETPCTCYMDAGDQAENHYGRDSRWARSVDPIPEPPSPFRLIGVQECEQQ